MSNHAALQLITLDARSAGQLRFEGPVLRYPTRAFQTDTRRHDTLAPHSDSSGQRSGGHDDGRGRRFTLPLDKMTYISDLTTIDWQEADSDIQRILDGATGRFHDDFAQRS